MSNVEGQTQTAYTRVRQSIVEGRYPPGTRLVEQRIADELALSRTPVREALKMLEAEGLVTIERHVGALVRRLDRDSIVDLYELRARLESFAAFRAATRRTDAHLALLDESLVGFGAAIAADDVSPLERLREIDRCNSQLHGTILDAAANDRLTNVIVRLVDVPLVFQAFRRFAANEMQRSLTFHELIVDAIATRDAPRAERLMLEHIDQGRDVLLAALDRLGSLEAVFGDS